MDYNVFINLRLPRIIMAVMAGFTLAYVGSILQTIFKNPLASPDIIGMSSGASAGAAVAIVAMSGSFMITMVSAFTGGILAVILAIILANCAKKKRLASFVLSGIVVNSICQSIIMSMKLVADPEKQLGAIEFWMMGGLNVITLDKLLLVIPICLIALFVLYIISRKIELLALDDQDAVSLGINVRYFRPLVLSFSTLAVASVVSVVGLISFIGLIAPHIARLIAKRNGRSTWLLSGVLGSVLLVIADAFARSLFSIELPISIVTSIVGAPMLFFFMVKEDKLL